MRALQLILAYFMPLNVPAIETQRDEDSKFLERGLHYLFPEPTPQLQQESSKAAEVSYYNFEERLFSITCTFY